MDYQQNKEIRGEGAKLLKCPLHDTEYYAYPQTFGSTAGAHGGIGGAAMSTFTTEVVLCISTREAILFQTGKPFSRVRDFSCSAVFKKGGA